MTRTKRLAGALLPALLFLPPLAARADPSRAAVERALSGYENPVRATTLSRLGPGWERTAEALALAADARPVLRARAVAALAFSAGSGAALRRILALRARAEQGAQVSEALAAAEALAAVEGARAVKDLVPLLSHRVPDLRAAAATALGRTRAPEAGGALAQALGREKDAAVRLALEGALQASRPD